MSNLWKFGLGVTYLREEGYVSVYVTSCNGECYIVTVSSSFSEVCENPTRGRSWFFASIGLEVFHVKILCPLFLSAEFLTLDMPRTIYANRPYRVFARKFETF